MQLQLHCDDALAHFRKGGGVQGEATSLQFDWAWQAEGGGKRGAALDVNDLAAKRVLSPQTAEGIRQADPRTVAGYPSAQWDKV